MTISEIALNRGNAAVPSQRVSDAKANDSWNPPAGAKQDRKAAPWWGSRYAARLIVVDLLAVLAAGVGVHLIGIQVWGAVSTDVLGQGTLLALTGSIVLAWMLVLAWSGSRDPHAVGHGPAEYKQILNGTFVLFCAVAAGSYLFQWSLPRSYLVVLMPLGLLGLLAGRFVTRRWLHAQRRRGHLMADVVAVGTVRTVRNLIDDLHRSTVAGYRIVGVCIDTFSSAEFDHDGVPRIQGVPVLGGLEEAAARASSVGAHVVIVTATDNIDSAAVRRLSWELEKTDVSLVLAPALTNMAGPRIHTEPVAGLPLIHVDKPRYQGANRILKKTFDMVGAGLLVLLLSPVLLVTGVAVAATSRGGAFFLQERVGLNGKAFRMIKFRSMAADAEHQRAALSDEEQAAATAVNAVMFKVRNDPRITAVGAIIRRFSIDEVPQLFNVLRGEMSLVGPRPPLASEVAQYGTDARLRLLVKPGMTGLWQVSGRSDLSWEETVRLDTYYVENWSITADVVILFKTARAVVSSNGAY